MKKFYNYFEAPLPPYVDQSKIDTTRKFAVVNKEIATKTALRIKKILEKIYEKSASARKQSTVDALETLFGKSGRLGKGTARTVYLGNKNTVVKIAHNTKGLAQNETEFQILDAMEDELDSDKIQFIARLKDYDKTSLFKGPIWLEIEKAQKVTPKEWEKKFGIKFRDFARIIRGITRPSNFNNEEKQIYEKLTSNDNGSNLVDVLYLLADTYEILTGDFYDIRNWGKIGDRVVMVDLGATVDVYKNHYMKKPKPKW